MVTWRFFQKKHMAPTNLEKSTNQTGFFLGGIFGFYVLFVAIKKYGPGKLLRVSMLSGDCLDCVRLRAEVWPRRNDPVW